ncbi:MAG: ABC-F family ATP-binding cassette domain-containing protein [Proteobacteria bacterium]|nr:ABC-F family ATP-binding cassette domain-containing protein [Pseudomonadota bacterium]MBU1640262.1 ABC-F family ATP-binding cassette domain-containing protein [Pseudomonadota bacterium]
MAHILSCQNVSKSFGVHTLFSDISLSFEMKTRTGLIGPNGSGKSTLLSILAGTTEPDSGRLFLTKQMRVVYLSQSENFDGAKSVMEVVMESIGDHDEDHKILSAHMALSQAEFPDTEAKVATLSGGWLKRLSIACALAQDPDLLLLDEPTNHLDIRTILWLEKILRDAPFAFVLVSHDRLFLENVCNRIIELNRCYPDGFLSYPGNYSQFLEKRSDFLNSQQEQEASLANKVKREVEWLRRGPKARATKARSRIDEAYRLQDELSRVRKRNQSENQLQIDVTGTGRKTKKLLSAEKISKKMGDTTLFSDLSFDLGPGVRLGLAGNNGCGKTTLMHILYGSLPCDEGVVRRADGLKISLFDQKREHLDLNQTLRRALAPDGDSIVHQGRSIHVAGWAKRFLFSPDQLEMPVSHLSGGEQARILIARFMLQESDILLLDEPTNDLDISSINVLEENLLDFPGALVLVSHDRTFLDNIATQIIGFNEQDHTATLYGDYRQWLTNLDKSKEPPKTKTVVTKQKQVAKKKLTYKEQKELAEIEGVILATEKQLATCREKVVAPEIMADQETLNHWCTELTSCQGKIDALYLRWDELEKKQAE